MKERKSCERTGQEDRTGQGSAAHKVVEAVGQHEVRVFGHAEEAVVGARVRQRDEQVLEQREREQRARQPDADPLAHHQPARTHPPFSSRPLDHSTRAQHISRQFLATLTRVQYSTIDTQVRVRVQIQVHEQRRADSDIAMPIALG